MKKVVLLLLFLPTTTFSQQTINASIIYDNLQRDYILYVPAIYNSNNPIPLVLNFHGRTGTANGQMWHGDFRAIADSANFIIVHPQGLLNSSGETHWNVGQSGTVIDDIGFVSSLIDSISTSYNINSNRIYSTGMSNGAYMSYRLACELSDRIAAIGPVAGSTITYMINNCNPIHPTPIIHIHGEADSSCIYLGKPAVESIPSILNFWVNHNFCDTQAVLTQVPNINLFDSSVVEHYVWENGFSGVEVEHYKIINGGHTWPGSLFPNNNGLTNYDINASTEIWRFFSKYDINGLIISATSFTEIEIRNNKLLKIVNVLGKKTKIEKNIPLFYIFDDGSVKKKIIIE